MKYHCWPYMLSRIMWNQTWAHTGRFHRSSLKTEFMPLTDPRAVWSLKCWRVKENFHSFMSMQKCQLSKKPARSQLAEVSLEFTDKYHRHPWDCGSKVLGQFEVFSFTPTSSLGPLWAKNNLYLLQSSYLFLGTGAECVLCSIHFRFFGSGVIIWLNSLISHHSLS